jgi:hypothetical protein
MARAFDLVPRAMSYYLWLLVVSAVRGIVVVMCTYLYSTITVTPTGAGLGASFLGAGCWVLAS